MSFGSHIFQNLQIDPNKFVKSYKWTPHFFFQNYKLAPQNFQKLQIDPYFSIFKVGPKIKIFIKVSQ
jgi:hypothetical protein